MKKTLLILTVAVIGLMMMNHLTNRPATNHQQPQQKPVASKPAVKAKKTEVASVTSTPPSGPLVIREQATFRMMPSSEKQPVVIPESEARAKK